MKMKKMMVGILIICIILVIVWVNDRGPDDVKEIKKEIKKEINKEIKEKL